MDKFKMLSGEELVIQGAKKVNSTLPELGLKDIIPNNSWLEQKQIQSSLEARRHIVEVERIEKCGSLSQAAWNDELQLAEVTKNAGGHWQYVGHNIGRQLYLYPEEALYLMEVSCLQLKYNDVTVSIQQAYALLLKDNNSLIQYKVYASLSRLGYKVLRHTYVKTNDFENNETENKEASSSSAQTSEILDITQEQEEKRAKETNEIPDCEMNFFSNDENQENTQNAETVVKANALSNDKTCKIADITEKDKENVGMDEKTEENGAKIAHKIPGYEMNCISYTERCNNTANAEITKIAESCHQTREVIDVAEAKYTEDENRTDENTAKETIKIANCQINDVPNYEKSDNIANVKAVDSEDTAKNSEPICKVNDMIEEKLEDDEEKDQKTENNRMKSTDEYADCPMSDIENADVTVISNESNEVCDALDHLKNRITDNKTEGTLRNADIVQNVESSDEQNLLADNKENSKLNNPEIICMETDIIDEPKASLCVNLCDDDSKETKENFVEISEGMSNPDSAAIIQNKIEMLTCRELKPSNSDIVHHCINENLPDLYQKQIVTVKAPEEHLIPRNVFLNNTAYVLNLGNLKLKSVTAASSSTSQTYSVSDEANEQHVRRIRSGYSNESAQIQFSPQFFANLRFPQQTPHYRQFHYWNNFNYNWSYQRPFFQSMPFRFQFFPRMQPMLRCISSRFMFPNFENTDLRWTRKRKRENPMLYHLESIKNLALKLKGLVASGNRQEQNIQALQRLINTYNVRYKARIELTAQLDIVENEIILETIELDDDDQSSSKKKRKEVESYDENFNALKQFSLKIKELEAKKMLSNRHKRAFSNVVKTFNKSYSADIYVDSNYDVIDRRRIVIASSSDSDCAVEEISPTVEDTLKPRKSKKLRNPFHILKKLSEKQSSSKTSTDLSSRINLKKTFEYSEHLKKKFTKYWLPSEDDFGRAEVPLKSHIRNQMDHNEEFLYQFMRSQPVKFKNWLDAKIAYWQSCQEAALKYEAHSQNESTIKLDSLINPEDCTDLRNVLKKLSIIKTKKDLQEECSLSINFDVYNRDVSNFKKTKKPPPHFRVICIAESSKFPTGIDFATLHSKYNDDVGILFAIVGTASISYLQMNPVELPIYLPSNNLP